MLSEWLIIQGIIERGLIFALCIMPLYLTSRIIRFDDLSLEGSFGIGAAVMAFLLSKNIAWYYGLPIVTISGALAGLATGLLHTRLKLNNLISGIVVTTALFSINLKIAGSNLIISNKATLFTLLPPNLMHIKTALLLPLVCIIIYALRWLLKTECGFLFRAVGDNPQMLINLGKNPDNYIIAALMISNALTAFSGALFVQYVGYFSIWASLGILITALAGLILSENISRSFGYNVIIGSIIYQAIIATTFELNVDPEWNKLITALLIIFMIGFKQHATLFNRK